MLWIFFMSITEMAFHFNVQTYAPFNATLMYMQLEKLNLSSAHISCENIIGHYSSKCEIVFKSHHNKTAEQMRKLCHKVSTLEDYQITVDCDEKYEAKD